MSSVQWTQNFKDGTVFKKNKTKTTLSCKKQRRARRERESKRPGRNKKWSQTARGSKTSQTCVPPLVSFKLVRTRKSAATVCELTLVGFLPWTETRKRTQRINLDVLLTYFITYSQLVTLAVMGKKQHLCRRNQQASLSARPQSVVQQLWTWLLQRDQSVWSQHCSRNTNTDVSKDHL